MGGHTFDQCRGLTYDKHGDTKVYNESDLQYDLDHAYLEYANACVKVKLPPRPRVDVDTRRLTYVTVRDQYELAAAGHDGSGPTSHKNMLTQSDKAAWMQAEDTKLDALEFKHETWGYCSRAEPTKNGKKIYRNNFVYAAKPALGTPGMEGYHAARFKARLVCTARDEDIAGKDTYAPVIRHDTLRAFLSTCAADNHNLRCLDICNAFLLSTLEEPMYMELPPGERFDNR